jgi:hypothetical protein
MRTSSNMSVSGLGKIRILALMAFAAFMISACASVNIDAAKTLSKAGQGVAVQAQQNIMVSDKEYLLAMDSEAFLHGYNGSTESVQYKQLLMVYNDIQQELSKRAVVFEKLADLYDAFGKLAELDAGGQTSKALGELGGAIADYATQFKQPASDVTAIIANIGGIAATEIQKAEIREVSAMIRVRVEAFQALLENKLVREQMTGFRSLLAKDREAAFMILWNAEVFDPKPLLDDFGSYAGLVARSNAAALIKSDPKLALALNETLAKRLKRNQSALIGKSYDKSLAALKELVSAHKKLEQGAPLDMARLQAITAELRSLVILFGKVKSDMSANR